MRIDEVGRCAEALDGVRRRSRLGLLEWRYHGRLVARQLDDARLVIRASFAHRDALLQESPATFSSPREFARHMVIVADLTVGDPELIEDAIEAAWQLQRSAD